MKSLPLEKPLLTSVNKGFFSGLQFHMLPYKTCNIFIFNPNVVSVRSVKNGKSHRSIDGISVAVNSAKGGLE